MPSTKINDYMPKHIFVGATQMVLSQDDYRNVDEFKMKMNDSILGFEEKCKRIQYPNDHSIDYTTIPKVFYCICR
jgi:hypothetical protein